MLTGTSREEEYNRIRGGYRGQEGDGDGDDDEIAALESQMRSIESELEMVDERSKISRLLIRGL